MNKFRVLYIISVAALAMGFAACSHEDAPLNTSDDMLTFEVTIPSAMTTRVYSDGLNASKLNVAFYDVLKPGEAPLLSTFGSGINGEQITVTGTGDNKFTVSVPLAHGVHYNVVFWADAYNFSATSPYTFSPTGQTITMNYENVSMNDNTPDAFYAYVTNINGSASSNTNVTLKRAGAQLNLGASDYAEYNTLSTKQLTKSSYSFTEVPNAINLTTGGVVGTAKDVTIAPGPIPETSTQKEYFPLGSKDPVSSPIENAPAYMAMAYVLAGNSEAQLPSLTFTLGNENEESIVTATIPNVPYHQNYRTNIYGDILTAQMNLKVEVNAIFDGSYMSPAVKTVADLTGQIANAANGSTIVLGANLTATGRINIPAGKTLTIDLNGYNISDVCFVALTGSNVTFKGDGTVTGGSMLATVTAYNSTVNIEGGNFIAGIDSQGRSNSCIFSEQGGIVNISGGTFKCQLAAPNGTTYYVLNRMNGSTGYFVCTGGTFYNYNPENGDDADGGNWVADGYTVQADGDVYTVVEK